MINRLSRRSLFYIAVGSAVLVTLLACLAAASEGIQHIFWVDFQWTFAAGVMVFLAAVGWYTASGTTRQARKLLLWGVISSAVGQLLWDFQDILRQPILPGLIHVLYLGLALFFIAAWGVSMRGKYSSGVQIAFYLDTGVIFTALGSMLSALYLPHAVSRSSVMIGLMVAYPVIFFSLAVGGGLGALTLHGRLTGENPYILFGGVGFLGVVWSIWNWQGLGEWVGLGSWTGYGFSLAYLWIGLGVAHWDLIPSDNHQFIVWSRRLIRIVPIFAIPMGVLILMWEDAQLAALGLWANLGGALVIILALFRQSLLFWERDRLFIRENAALNQMQRALEKRQQAETERQVLLDIMRGGVLTPNLTNFLALVHHAIGRVLYAENFFISLYDKTTGLFEQVYFVDQYDQPTSPHALDKSVSAFVFRNGQPLLLLQDEFEKLIARGEVELLGTNSPSWLGVPLKSPTETIGVMVVQDYERADVFTAQDLEFMSSIAGQIALVVEKKRAETALLQFRALMDETEDAIFLIDLGTGQCLDFNNKALIMLGYSREEMRHLHILQISDALSGPEAWATHVLQVLEQDGLLYETTFQHKEGPQFPVEVSARILGEATQGMMVAIVRDITDRKQAEEELKRRGDQFASLYELSRDLAAQWDLPRLLETVVDRAIALLSTPGGGLYLYDPEKNDLSVEVSRGAGFPTGVRLKLGEGLAGRVAQSHQPLLIEDYQVWEGRAHYYDHIPIRAVMGVPMFYGGDLIGVLLVEHIGEYTKPFTEADVRLLSMVAGQVASAVHNARLFETLHRRLGEQDAVSRVSTALRTAQNLDEMLPLLLHETLAVIGTEAGGIVLHDPARGGLVPVVEHNWFKQVDHSPIRPGEGIAGRVFQTSEVYRIENYKTDPLIRPSFGLPAPDDWGGMCLPIRTAQEPVGVLFIAVKLPRVLTESEEGLLTTLCEIAGNAIHRTRLHEQTQQNVHRLAALHVIDLAITSSFDLRVSLNILLENVLSLLEADVAIISRLQPSLQQLEYLAGRGLYTPLSSRMPLGDRYAHQAAYERKSISIPDLTADNTFEIPRYLAGEGIRAYHAVPLTAKGQVKGILQVFHRAPFQPETEWLNFLQTLGGQAAIALDNAELFAGLQRSNMELTLAYEATIEGWSRALDLRDEETEGHTQRVTEMTLQLAKAIGVDSEELSHIRRGALLHDIGKMGVPDRILLKPGPLTPEEWQIMRRHPEYAYEMLAPIEYLHSALDIPYCHHEKWDGTGYPRGLAGEQIPLAARVFTVVDVWDALLSDRPYHDPWPEDQVRAYLCEQSGIYFDPQIVKVFLDMLAREDRP